MATGNPHPLTQAPCTPALAHAPSLDTDRTRNARAPILGLLEFASISFDWLAGRNEAGADDKPDKGQEHDVESPAHALNLGNESVD